MDRGIDRQSCRGWPKPPTTREERLEAQLAALPAQPGVYLFRDAADAVLYVGKAKSLRARVRSYFRGGDARQGLERMVARVERIEVIVTQSEGEALHLEQNLIKRHRPPFNVRLRDDKSYPYIAVTVGDEYPRVMFTRERHRRGVVYFGPYSYGEEGARDARRAEPRLPLPAVRGPETGAALPASRASTSTSTAASRPASARSPRTSTARSSTGVVEFLSGETRPIQRELERRMQEAAERTSSKRRRASATGSSQSAISPSARPPTAGTSGRST